MTDKKLRKSTLTNLSRSRFIAWPWSRRRTSRARPVALSGGGARRCGPRAVRADGTRSPSSSICPVILPYITQRSRSTAPFRVRSYAGAKAHGDDRGDEPPV